MEEVEKADLIHNISGLAECIMHLEQAKKALNDVDDTDNFYFEIHLLRDKINDFKLQKEAEL